MMFLNFVRLKIELINLMLLLEMKTKTILWWIGMVIAILSAIVTYCSCTAGITMGHSNSIQQTVTNRLDSTVTTFSLTPIGK